MPNIHKLAILKSVKRVTTKLLFFIALIVIPGLTRNPSPAFAVTNPQSFTATVSATVPDLSFNPPVLISPEINAALNTTRPSFSWSRPSPLPTLSPLHHYDFYLDGSIFATTIPDSLLTQDYYFYTASTSADIFNVLLKTDLSQGYHTWRVIAFTENGISSASETRNFYIDSITPFISVTKVDRQSLSWNTAIHGSIPPIDNRHLTVTTKDPTIKGDVESFSNFQIILICPQNIPKCEIQIFTGNISSGHWETHFSNLLPNQIYTIKISATDAAGNSTIFPDFFVTYPVSLSLTLPSTSISPPIELLNLITPAPIIPSAPPAPTPPVSLIPQESAKGNFTPALFVLLIFGLPLHLFMSIIGTETPITFIPRFLFILAFPFLRKKKYQTTPFTFITLFIANKLDRPWQLVASDIQGFYNLKNNLPENIFLRLSAFGKLWKDNLTKGYILPISCLFPLPVRQLTAQNHLHKIVYDTRIIPLIIACLTSITVFVIRPSYPVFIYVYFSLQYLFSEYVYPKI